MKLNEAEMRMAYQIESTDPNAVLNEIYMTWRLSKNQAIMIAHRLKTVRHANQILVVDHGRIVQHGTHDQLIQQKGIYADFILNRKAAIDWKINA